MPKIAVIALIVIVATFARTATPTALPVTRGQSPAEVRARLGPPLRVSRQLLLGRYLEQWAYDEPRPLRVEFNCVRGEDPFVCAILLLPPAQP
jgi:hypothetical protein